MIVQLHGAVEEKRIDSLVLLVNGVGYEVYTSTTDLDKIVTNQDIVMFIYENIREQSHDLFGFLDNATKIFFEKLITVNGVGPKMALSVMNIGRLSEIQQAIAQGNTKYLQSASGIGKRVAERIIVDLKDKIGVLSLGNASRDISSNGNIEFDEAFEALISLGYSAHDASRVLAKIDPALSVEEKIKIALRSHGK